MRSKLLFLLAVLAWVAPAAAADRALLAPSGAASTLSTSPAASAMLQSLRQSAATRGHVKVIVGLRVPFAAEAALEAGMRDAQRHDIAVASGALRTRFAAAAARHNLSLGGGRYSGTCDGAFPAMTAAIANLRSAGIATVIAAGNDYHSDSAAFPACISGAVSVGAVSDSDWGPCFDGTPTAADRIACYSNDDPFVSLLAPGSAITSSVPGGGYETWHGTSMAAPHITGAWAVLKQRMPNATVADVLAAFQKTGTPVTDTRGTRYFTRPRADVAAALTQFVTLSYTADGDGSGTASFRTARGTTTCNASCAITMITGTAVSVTVRPASGSTLLGWSGACGGRGPCSFTVAGTTSLDASFGPASTYDLSYDRAGSGTGTVLFRTAGGTESCADGCAQSYTQGTLVMLTAIPGRRSRFLGWSGDCGRRRICVLKMSAAKSVTARFGGR